jgi:hypothetical protein
VFPPPSTRVVQSSLRAYRDEAVERRQTPYELLGSLEVPDWLHVHDGRDFLGIGFDASLGYDESKQLLGWGPQRSISQG